MLAVSELTLCIYTDLIENDRRSPNPYIATAAKAETPESSYELMNPEARRRELNEIARKHPCSEIVAGKAGAFFLTDVNCYRRLNRELTRWVTSVMSLNNPNCHVPTDAEIQHKARCIIFDELAPILNPFIDSY
jgi:hypothetical protein